jgi:hypothetical protein
MAKMLQRKKARDNATTIVFQPSKTVNIPVLIRPNLKLNRKGSFIKSKR